MSLQDQDGTPDKCPASMKNQIRRAIAEHLQEHGDCSWDLVREKPEFAPYIGKETGETGRKRLQRWKKELSRNLSADRTRPHEARALNEQHAAWAEATAQALAASGELAFPPTEPQLRTMGTKAIKIAQVLQVRLRQNSDDIDRLWQAAVVADPDGPGGFRVCDHKLMARVIQLRLQLMAQEQSLLRDAARISDSDEFVERVVASATSFLADDPQKRDGFLQQFENLRLEMGMVESAA